MRVLLLLLMGTVAAWPCKFERANLTYDFYFLHNDDGYVAKRGPHESTWIYYNFCEEVGAEFSCDRCENGGNCSPQSVVMNTVNNNQCHQYGSSANVQPVEWVDYDGLGAARIVFPASEGAQTYHQLEYTFVCDPKTTDDCKNHIAVDLVDEGKKYAFVKVTVQCEGVCGQGHAVSTTGPGQGKFCAGVVDCVVPFSLIGVGAGLFAMFVAYRIAVVKMKEGASQDAKPLLSETSTALNYDGSPATGQGNTAYLSTEPTEECPSPACTEQLPIRSNFCLKCGVRVDWCPSCSAALEAGALCVKCNTIVPPSPQFPPPTSFP